MASKKSGWTLAHATFNRAADERFYRLGYWVATHPKQTLLLNLAFVAICAIGFINFDVVTDGEVLWVPANSLSKQQEKIIKSYFQDGSDYALLLLESAVEERNLLTKSAVDKMWELNAKVMAVETERGNTYTDLCTTELNTDTCRQPLRGITRFWGNNFATYEASVTSDEDIMSAISVLNYPDGQLVVPQAVFGNSFTYDDTRGEVVSASVVIQMYELELDLDDDEMAFEVLDWQERFHNLIEDIRAGEDGGDEDGTSYDELRAFFNLRYYTGRSLDDALIASVDQEVHLFVITYLAMTLFATINLGRCGAGSVQRRSWLGAAGVLAIVSAGVAAYGLNSGFGVPFTSLSKILPFILIGIGVDDMVVLVSSFDHTNPMLPVEKRIALAVKRCGVSITYTSLTNFFAFILGSTTSLPAVEYFCLYAGTAILFDFFFQMTGFVACLTLDAKRQVAGRKDWLCCFKGDTRYHEHSERVNNVDCKEAEGGEYGKSYQHTAAPPGLTGFGRFIKDRYTPAILSTTGKTIVLLGAAGLLAAGVYGVLKATQGFDVIDLAPDGHHARLYTNMAREYELEIETQYIPLSIYTMAVDYPDVSVQAQIQATDELMVDQRFVVGPVSSWLATFMEWTANSSTYSANVGTSGGYPVYDDPTTFYTALSEFIDDGDNIRFESDFVFDAGGKIQISRSTMYLIDMTSTDNGVDALRDSREVVGESTLDPPPFSFSQYFILSEQFLVIYDELIMSFSLALVAVVLLSILVIGNLKIVVLISLTVVIIDVDLLGFVYHWGLDVNSVTAIELIMAVGLVVDYMVHIIHYYLHQDPNSPRDIRLADGLGEIGPSVVVGAATTFVGILPLGLAESFVFRVFFKMFLIIIGFGFFHGVCFIPVALAVLPLDAGTSSSGEADVKKGESKRVEVAKQARVVPQE